MTDTKQRHLHALPDLAEDADYPVTLKAPGRPEREHPFMGPVKGAIDHMMAVRHHMIHDKMSLYEADQVVLKASASHDGRGRKFQPSHLR